MPKIRNLDVKDIDIVAMYEKEISKISFQKDAITDIKFHRKKLIKALENEKYGMFVLCDDKNKVIGWLWLNIKKNSITNEKYIDLKSIYIDKKYRNYRYEKRLIKYTYKFARKYNIYKVVAKINYKNKKIKKLLLNNNFTEKHITMELNV